MSSPVLTRPEGAEPADFHLSRRALGGLMFAGYALGAGPINARTITTDSEGLITREATVPAADGFDLPVYLATPADTRRRRPVVIVVSEIFGLHEYIRDTTRRLAKAGYVAVAPAFFVREADPAPITDFARIREIVGKASHAQVMSDIDSTLRWLDTNPDVGQGRAIGGRRRFADMNRVGITGFCWGGAVTWLAVAENPRIKSGVAWYGRLVRPQPGGFLAEPERVWPVEVAARLNGPVLGLYAENDQGIPLADVEAMRAALRQAGKTDSEIVVYPGARHGFHADYREVYKADAAQDGWNRLLDWFRRTL